jgi:protein-disulfide isomerase
MADEIGAPKKSGGAILGLLLVIVLIAAIAFFFLKPKDETAPSPEEQAQIEAPVDTNAPAVTEETTADEQTNSVVVETKSLAIDEAGKQKAAEILAALPKDPAVDAMMSPRTIGDPNAPVKITEYSSLTCGHCAHFHKESLAQFKKEFIETGKVQLTYQEFPLNQPALDASMILRCLPEDKYLGFMDLLFTEQENWAFAADYKDKLRQNAKLAGMSDEDFDACLGNDNLRKRLVAEMQAASEQFKIQSTPSFVINEGQRVLIGNQPLTTFAEAIEQASANPAVTAPAPAAVTAPPAEQPAAE